MGAELKKFRFTFGGTLSDFNQAVVDLQSDNDDYLFDEKDGRYSFGVARGGHSGGYWYTPEYTETEAFSGRPVITASSVSSMLSSVRSL